MRLSDWKYFWLNCYLLQQWLEQNETWVGGPRDLLLMLDIERVRNCWRVIPPVKLRTNNMTVSFMNLKNQDPHELFLKSPRKIFFLPCLDENNDQEEFVLPSLPVNLTPAPMPEVQQREPEVEDQQPPRKRGRKEKILTEGCAYKYSPQKDYLCTVRKCRTNGQSMPTLQCTTLCRRETRSVLQQWKNQDSRSQDTTSTPGHTLLWPAHKQPSFLEVDTQVQSSIRHDKLWCHRDQAKGRQWRIHYKSENSRTSSSSCRKSTAREWSPNCFSPDLLYGEPWGGGK